MEQNQFLVVVCRPMRSASVFVVPFMRALCAASIAYNDRGICKGRLPANIIPPPVPAETAGQENTFLKIIRLLLLLLKPPFLETLLELKGKKQGYSSALAEMSHAWTVFSMARKEYLSAEDRARFENPPLMQASERSLFFQLPDWARQYLRALLHPTNQVGFLLQLGYFRIIGRFFLASRYGKEDIDFVTSKLIVDPNGVNMEEYSGTTYHRH